jgi:GNAT superfamily N-acetyltransferase
MPLDYRAARAEDIAECFVLRGKTRENAIDRQRLEAAGVTVDSWTEETRSGALVGHVCTSEGTIVGYCFGSPVTGEVVVLALLPPFEGRGIGRALLERVVHDLRRAGHARLFLGSSPDPATRSHGFYRHLGWRSTGRSDAAGDEVLEYVFEGCSRSRTR